MVIALFAVAALLLYFGVRLILRELKKKKGRLAGERQPAEEMPAVEENQPVPEADQADHTENKEE